MTVTEFPELPALVSPDGRFWCVWCTYCRRTHHHGAELGHRTADCPFGSPYSGCGYIGVPSSATTVKELRALTESLQAREPAATETETAVVPAWVYRPFDAEGGLLYIGVSKDFGGRWKKHAQTQPWWPEVRHMTTTWYPDEASAYAAETEAILAEKPRWNIAKTRPRRGAA